MEARGPEVPFPQAYRVHLHLLLIVRRRLGMR